MSADFIINFLRIIIMSNNWIIEILFDIVVFKHTYGWYSIKVCMPNAKTIFENPFFFSVFDKPHEFCLPLGGPRALHCDWPRENYHFLFSFYFLTVNDVASGCFTFSQNH